MEGTQRLTWRQNHNRGRLLWDQTGLFCLGGIDRSSSGGPPPPPVKIAYSKQLTLRFHYGDTSCGGSKSIAVFPCTEFPHGRSLNCLHSRRKHCAFELRAGSLPKSSISIVHMWMKQPFPQRLITASLSSFSLPHELISVKHAYLYTWSWKIDT